MRIGGLQPVTLLDYPEKIAAIIFTAGCNMRCPFCYNSGLVLPEVISDDKLYAEPEVSAFLARRKKYLDGLVVSGGEPTLQADLPEFLAKMKRLGYAVKLDTNGLLPEVLSRLVADKLLDYIAMDIKGPLDDYEKFSGVSGEPVKASIKIVMKSGLPYEFRSTLVRGLHAAEDLEQMAAAIKGAKKYFLQNYSNETPLAGEKFKGKPWKLKDLEQFKQTAEKYVRVCQIR